MDIITATKPPKIYNSILEAIGRTPLIRLQHLPKEEGVECDVLVKCEFFNPTGCHKDRLALNILESAEKNGSLKKGGTIIEATGGNTGLGLCFVASVKGYKSVMVATSHTSQEKIDIMQGFGADVIKNKNTLIGGPEGALVLSQKVHESIPGSLKTLQFENKANPEAHYKSTSEELLYQTDGKLDYFFMAVGTGGTISGTSKKLKEKLPGIKIIGCDPHGSCISHPEIEFVPNKIEGIGLNFVPKNCDKTLIDEWVNFADKDAFLTARKLMKTEGIMAGGSAGGILWSVFKYAKEHKLGKDKTIVAVLPDTGRNYLTKFLNNEWMLENNFISEEEYRKISMENSVIPEKRLGDDLCLKDLRKKALNVIKIDKTLGDTWKMVNGNMGVMINETGLAKDGNYFIILINLINLNCIKE